MGARHKTACCSPAHEVLEMSYQETGWRGPPAQPGHSRPKQSSAPTVRAQGQSPPLSTRTSQGSASPGPPQTAFRWLAALRWGEN